MSSSQTLYALIKQLADKKIKIWLETGTLKFKAPKGALNAELRNTMLVHKEALIDFLKEQEQSAEGIGTRSNSEDLPISNAQQRLWFIDQYGIEKDAYNIPVALSLKGTLNIEALQYAVDTLISRHEILQTYFDNKNGLPFQKKVKNIHSEIIINDISHLSDLDKDFQTEQVIEENISNTFDLSKWPLFKLDLIKKDESDYIFLATMHHIIADGWSMSLLIKEIAEYYQSYIKTGVVSFSPHVFQYADYAYWQNEYLNDSRSQSLLTFWTKYLKDSSVLELPLDKKRLSNQTAKGRHQHFLIRPELQSELVAFANQHGVTLFMLLSAAFNLLLSRFSRQENINIGVPIANRNRPEWESIIGFFVNTLVLRSDLSGNPKFSEFLKQVQENTLAIYSKQEMPFDRLVEALSEQRDSNFSPLFQVMFSLQNTPGEQKISLPELEIEILDYHLSHSRFDMTWNLTEQSVGDTLQGIDIDLEYNSDIFNQSTVKLYLQYYEYLLQDIVRQEDQVLSAYRLQSPELILQKAEAFNPTPSEYPKDSFLVEVFESISKLHKNSIAISTSSQILSYQDLAKSTEQISAYLQSKNIQQGDRVIVALPRSIEMIQAILAILKIGACYVPIDSDYPDERKHYILKDSQAKIIVSAKSQEESLDSFDRDITNIIFLEDAPVDSSVSIHPITNSSTAHLPACIFYTSGSTGEPKGVIIPHRAILRLVCNTNFVSFSSEEVVAHVSNVCFDAASMEIWGALLNGGRLHIVSQDILLAPQRFAEELHQQNISVMFLTMGLFRVYAHENPTMFSGLNTLLIGGEAVDLNAASKVLTSGAAPKHLVNGYGPTENTTFSACHLIKEITEQTISVPLGKAIANSQVYIADAEGRILPAGIEGELICAGDGLALAYLNKEQLTKEKFIEGYLQGLAKQRVYLSGDLARYSPEGEIILSGRLDEQIKLRGYRIEPGEIEYVIENISGVHACSVCLKENSDGNKFLVAYVLFDSIEKSLQTIKDAVRQHLPAYMFPSFFVEIERLPLNANGKVDKKALPEPNWQQIFQDDYIAPGNELEQRLSDIWSDLLAINKPSINANFFELGGHSLLATQLVSRIYEHFTIELKVKEIFEHASIIALAKLLQSKNNFSLSLVSSDIEIKRVDRLRAHPLSKAQQRLWFIHQMDKESSAYSMPMAVRIKGPLDTKRLERSLGALIKRHESLRTLFISENNEVKQFIGDAKDHYSLAYRTVLSDRELKKAINDNQTYIFDLENGPIFIAELIHINISSDEEDYLLLMNMHHIISDGWSMQILKKDLLSIYQNDGAQQLPELTIQYIDYSVWQSEYLNDERNKALINFWRQELRDVPDVLHLPSDKPRPEQQNFEGSLLRHQLDSNLQERVLIFCKENQITSFVLGFSAYALLLSKYSQQQDFCIGIPVSGRQKKSLESIVGFFVNGLVLRSDLRNRMSVEEFLAQNKEKALSAFAHQDLSADVLIDTLGIKPNSRHQPLAQVAFSHQSYQRKKNEDEIIEDIHFEVLESENQSAKYELILSLGDSGTSLDLACEYASALFDRETITKLLEHYEFILGAMVDNSASMLDEISWYREQDILTNLNNSRSLEDSFQKAYPLSSNQQAIYLDALINPNTIQNSIANFMELSQEIDAELWQRAFRILQSNHEQLRSEIVELNILGERKLYQGIIPLDTERLQSTFSYYDLTDINISFVDLPKYLEDEAYCTYNVEKDCLYHYSLYKLANGHYATMLRAHHILFDGVSGKVFLEEMVNIYQALINNTTINLTKDNFSEFIVEQNKTLDKKDCLHFWREQSMNVAGLSFDAFDVREESDHKFLQKEHRLSDETSLSIRRYCRRKKITPSIFFKCLYINFIEQYCRPEADFFIREYGHGRAKGYESSYGVYYQQTPFVIPLDLFSGHDFDEELLSSLFLYAANFQKKSRSWRNISIQSQATLFPTQGIGFIYNYTHFESDIEFFGKAEKTLFLSPRAEKQVQLFIREHGDYFELLLLYGNDYFKDYQLLLRIEDLAKQLLDENRETTSLKLLMEEDQQTFLKSRLHSSLYEPESNDFSLIPTLNSKQERTALYFSNKQITYSELESKSDALACYLVNEYRVGCGQRVALHLPLNDNYLIALLAIIKAGASYVPVQVDYPSQRIKNIIDAADIHCIISEYSFRDGLVSFPISLCLLDEFDLDKHKIDKELLKNIESQLRPKTSLYSIFTSGSTGLPKGAQVSYQGELNLLTWYEEILGLNEEDKSIVISASGFDLTQKNFFAFLRCGGSLVFPDMEVFDPSVIRQLIADQNVTHINCAPSAFYALLEGGESSWQQLTSLRWVILGGEAILVSELRDWYESKLCHAEIMNSYGPTECTDVVSYYILQNKDFKTNNRIPLGGAINNTQLYILNGFHQQLPVGLVGEIAIGGSSLGLGYIDQTKLNQEKFIEIEFDTCSAKSKEKVYLTGDLGRVNIDGELEYIGRKDFQIKLRGQRIELGEIENVLRAIPDIRDALVLVQEENLIAYILPSSLSDKPLNTENILKDLSISLAAYMLPQLIIALESWPLNSNGKIDRKALPAADFSLVHTREIIKPRNEIEQVIYEMWRDVLGKDDIGVFDSFFELGGHSLLATKAVSRLKEHFQVEFPLKALFDLHNIADIAEYIKTLLWALESKDSSSQTKEADAKNREEGTL